MRISFVNVFVALLMISLAHSAPKGLDVQEDSSVQRMPFDDEEGDGARSMDDDADDLDDDSDDLMSSFQSDQPKQVKLDNNLNPTDLNNNGVTVDGEGSCERTDPANKQCKNDGCDKSGGTCNGGSSSGRRSHVGCQKPHSPKHGGFKTRGNYVEYYCHRGYQLHGPKRSKCVLTNGKHRLQHRTPECRRRSRYVLHV